MSTTISKKLARIKRRLTLMRANTAAALGEHDKARELFASVGIGYCVFLGEGN